ncbi:sialate O-acetylesterase [Flavitalea flava]
MKKTTGLYAFVLLITVLATSVVRANLRLPRLFMDNMVIQRDQPVAIWGWADAGEHVIIQFNGQNKKVKADKKGKWLIHLDPVSAGGPFQMVISGKHDRLTFTNILVGEVWICSGQSNMEFQVQGVNGASAEIEQADFPQIRHFKVPAIIGLVPRDSLAGGDWQICSKETVGNFTAVGYFFARELYRKLHVPVGLINTTWGGTHVETWTSKGAFEKSEEFKNMIAGLPTGAEQEAAASQKKEALLKAIGKIQGSIPPSSETGQYKDPSYDDSHWAHMKLPGLWEQAGLGLEDLDGIVWFRKILMVDEADAGKPAILELGKIDDSDDGYVNGIKIGSTKNRYSDNRVYTIPAGILKPGRNSIAVRVEDTGGGGGINGDPGTMKCTIAGKVHSLEGDWSFRVTEVSVSSNIGPNSSPTLLYNGMINPLIPYSIKGVIWYQGEANAGRAYQYRKSFPLMIEDWRSRWQEGNFPFYFVQLSSWDAEQGNSSKGSGWAELREAQTMTLSLPATGMTVTTDIGDPHDIHPKNKQDVGIRLAAIALNSLYGKTMEFSGPIYQSMQTKGNTIILTFSHIGAGLAAHDKYGYLKGFEMAGTDKKFHYAKAEIRNNTVIVSCDAIDNPQAVRYGWADDAGESNFFNLEGFPASPFRTDQWKGVTEDAKYEMGR